MASTAPRSVPAAVPGPNLFTRLKLRDLVLIPVIALVMVIGSFVSSSFLMPENLLNVLQQSSELSILVIAQSLILICGKFDLSLESTVGIAPMFAAWLMIADTYIGGCGPAPHGPAAPPPPFPPRPSSPCRRSSSIPPRENGSACPPRSGSPVPSSSSSA